MEYALSVFRHNLEKILLLNLYFLNILSFRETNFNPVSVIAPTSPVLYQPSSVNASAFASSLLKEKFNQEETDYYDLLGDV